MTQSNISRRTFLGGAVVLTAAASVPMGLKALRRVPVLYGDGVHDDTKALQALIDGKPVRMGVGGEVVESHGGNIKLGGGKFLISETLNVTTPNTHIDGGAAQIIHDWSLDPRLKWKKTTLRYS